MKNLFILLVCILTLGSYGQTSSDKDVTYFLGAGIAPEENLSIEYKGGMEFSNLRYTISIETRSSENFTKITWFTLDYIIPDFPFYNFGTYIGVENSTIFTTNPNPDYTDAYNYRRKTSTGILNPGLNLEFQYRMYRKLYCAIGTSIYQAEQDLINKGQKTRKDVTFSIYWKV